MSSRTIFFRSDCLVDFRRQSRGISCASSLTYAVASLVAVSRLQRNKHNLSDVVAGAAVGYIVGRTVVRVNGGRPGPGSGASISVTPLVGRRTRGLVVAVAF